MGDNSSDSLTYQVRLLDAMFGSIGEAIVYDKPIEDTWKLERSNRKIFERSFFESASGRLMIDDQDLGFFANFLGIFIFLLVIAYHYVMADPKYEGN
ncbi:hypothetical protein BUALT_Bualt10G0082700 [Buddleja alternifolia]|uniref:Dolichyl-diphosphooligosaccharide--protein glycosyltransferase subunit 4 n=1 Tax=Buddleja alternifolia TaxID=168488 RepID=A0AAV6X3L8_9LAMI|nr:hypothetical protein BUALT_Bualt10G0082700 [Buddleja alternifolia]